MELLVLGVQSVQLMYCLKTSVSAFSLKMVEFFILMMKELNAVVLCIRLVSILNGRDKQINLNSMFSAVLQLKTSVVMLIDLPTLSL